MAPPQRGLAVAGESKSRSKRTKERVAQRQRAAGVCNVFENYYYQNKNLLLAGFCFTRRENGFR